MRIYLVNRNLRPKAGSIEIEVLSPDDVVYQKDSLNETDMVNGVEGMFQLTFDFPLAPKYGLWKIKVTPITQNLIISSC